MLDWTLGRLETQEAEDALKVAGLDPDCAKWTQEELELASFVLDLATDEKRRRLLSA